MFRITCSLLSVAALAAFSSSTQAGLVHQYSFDADASDSVGTADLDINGGAAVSGGRLVLPGTGTRVDNAAASGAALVELASTINGADQLSIAAKFTVDTARDWQKLFMAGTPGAVSGDADHDYIDITPQRGGNTRGITIRDNGHEDKSAFGPGVPTATETIMVGVWDTANDVFTVHSVLAGDGAVTSQTETTAIDLSDLVISTFYLGSPIGWPDSDFHGSIDWVNIYDQALTSEQVSLLSTTGQIPEPNAILLALCGLGFAGFRVRK